MIDREKLEERIKTLSAAFSPTLTDPKVEVSVVSYGDMTRLAEIWRDALQRTRAAEEKDDANDDCARHSSGAG